MDAKILEETLEVKIAGHLYEGLSFEDALRRAGDETLAQAATVLKGADLFCFTMYLKGALNRIEESWSPGCIVAQMPMQQTARPH